MRKSLVAITSIVFHFLVIASIVVGSGVLHELADEKEEDVIKDKFTGELEKNVTLQILENDTAKSQGYLQELLDAFNEKYKAYGIQAVDAKIGEYSDLTKDGPYGYGPDVLYQANDVLMGYVEGHHIQPLPVEKLECYEKIDQKAWNPYTLNQSGTSYICGVPVNIQGPLLFYRKDLLPSNWKEKWDKNNNDIPDMVESWTELYAYSKEIRKATPDKYGYMESLSNAYFSSGYLFSYGGYLFGKDGRDLNDIGLSKGNAVKGASIIRQLATIMNRECCDDSITLNSYSQLGNGTYFATMTTPDVYSLFINNMIASYRKETPSLTEAKAREKAKENLVITNVPSLPKNGDLENRDDEMFTATMMGGVNGYAMSAYTKYPNAALEFINFATSYQMIKKRIELLSIVPARVDLAKEQGGLAETINNNLKEGYISVMPSVSAMGQVWTSAGTFFADLSEDPFREEKKQKYTNEASILEGLMKVDQQIYDAVHTLK